MNRFLVLCLFSLSVLFSGNSHANPFSSKKSAAQQRYGVELVFSDKDVEKAQKAARERAAGKNRLSGAGRTLDGFLKDMKYSNFYRSLSKALVTVSTESVVEYVNSCFLNAEKIYDAAYGAGDYRQTNGPLFQDAADGISRAIPEAIEQTHRGALDAVTEHFRNARDPSGGGNSQQQRPSNDFNRGVRQDQSSYNPAFG